ncbi:hypothetical protein BDP55DRAFT_670223 [Colletotrichum godetiae]|uniref:Uncharacterized protein n=1 Tax=Colletotrichum godetiae TaxID=1209918 RepID=A0AAJ0AGF6_9PEZI|nr:uncharacterized protein BDP55DRAFT_670223 [Colletotrichum godetiae]KAK1673436.1 hypothetical protein BDP55DRAFT_670223 [Colletotrichum godetiae]
MKLTHPHIALQIALVKRVGATDILVAYKFSVLAAGLLSESHLTCDLSASRSREICAGFPPGNARGTR